MRVREIQSALKRVERKKALKSEYGNATAIEKDDKNSEKKAVCYCQVGILLALTVMHHHADSLTA
jgi:hypothetical protein